MLKFKIIVLFLLTVFLSVGCRGQKNENNIAKEPKGTWRVDKEFDENGNLIRYDSIYSWSSTDALDTFSQHDKDSLMQSYKSKFFENFSSFENEGFEAIFSQDSLFSEFYFNDDFFQSPFGNDFMDIDRIRQRMIERQKKFLEKYESEFIEPEK